MVNAGKNKMVAEHHGLLFFASQVYMFCSSISVAKTTWNMCA